MLEIELLPWIIEALLIICIGLFLVAAVAAARAEWRERDKNDASDEGSEDDKPRPTQLAGPR